LDAEKSQMLVILGLDPQFWAQSSVLHALESILARYWS